MKRIFLFTILLTFSFCSKKISLVKINDPLSPEEHFQLGMIYLSSKEFSSAQKQFKNYVKQKPKDYLGWFYLGVCEQELNRYQKASRAYKKTISLNPDYAPAYNNLADLYLKKHKLTQAEELVKKAIELNGENLADYYLTYAQILLAKNQKALACQLLEKAEKTKPSCQNKNILKKLWQTNCQKK